MELKLNTAQALAEKDIDNARALADARKRSNAIIEQKSREIRHLTAEVQEMHDLAMDVAVEHHDVAISAKEAEKKMGTVQTLADTRNLKLKATINANEKLRDCMESDQDCYLQIIEDAYNHIDELQSQLNEFISIKDILELACEIATNDINVSCVVISTS